MERYACRMLRVVYWVTFQFQSTPCKSGVPDLIGLVRPVVWVALWAVCSHFRADVVVRAVRGTQAANRIMRT